MTSVFVLAILVFGAVLSLLAWVAISQVVGIAKRTSRLARRLNDPRQLEALLGEETRAALRQAGVDPFTALQAGSEVDPALRERVAADVKRALEGALKGGLVFGRFGSVVFGRAGADPARPVTAPAATAPPEPGPTELGAAPSVLSPRASEPPPPYQVGGDPGARIRVVLAVAVIAAAAALVLALR